MFEKLLKELKQLDNTKISIPIDTDENGFFDRECPDEECMFVFKVHEEDWEKNFKDESVFCPMCGNESTSDTFCTTEQVDNAHKQATEFIEGKIHKAMKDDAKSFNSRQPKGGFISMSMSVKGHTPQKLIIPIPSQEIFEQKIKCEKCESRYSVIGSAFFCPCCGHNSVEQTFNNTINKIESSINNIPTIKKTLNELSKDQAENTCQTLIEKCLLDSVVAFQRYCDIMYSKHKNAKLKVPFNAFQKLDIGGELWQELFNESYQNWLSDTEYKRLNILFQRRHLLQHTEGIVDEKYIAKSSDNKYKLGQRIVVKEKDAIELVNYIKTLTTQIRNKIE
ncbi:MAG: hypothetical protein OQJ96_10435 [Flavobacteriales bacterium]|nr:hypothetical protein [Flavobacteriales bacterium]MCW8914073.1 hypothetical protein [Flavobacteriales bacterium]MCW8938131.1 hypothetical protein [Flavobacteriales bacterium]MCW8939175.1 hypothetical protein [Flavobacteriales bacterium]MCW8968250.1 hypothetical protein [Flavobacteriales bacterium]